MIEIDGSVGEGGGQILRTALSLSMITGEAFAMRNIRANRPRPGLLRQHLTAITAAREVCSAEVRGAAIGASSIEFVPGTVRAGDYSFAIGSAGSTTLVLQAVLPALVLASSPSTVTLEGGTHNPSAPTAQFLERAFVPLLERMGPRVTVGVERYGFYPAGGGRIRVFVEPCESLAPVTVMDRGVVVSRHACAMISAISGEIAKRELVVVRDSMNWPDEALRIEGLDGSAGPGNVLSIEIQSENVAEVFTGFGRRGYSAEQVAQECVAEARAYLASGAAVWTHLADQLLLPLAIAGGGSYSTGPLTRHFETNAQIIERFLGVRVRTRSDNRNTIVELAPRR